MVIGDFNAHINAPFFHKSDSLREAADMLLVDVDRLAVDSFPQVNNASLSKSWLDHCLSTRSVNRCIENIEIVYDYFLSDHLPLTFDLIFEQLPVQLEMFESKRRIRWDFENTHKCRMFYQAVSNKLPSDPSQLLCGDTMCQNVEHESWLDNMWTSFVRIIDAEARRAFGTRVSRDQVVPGWNDLVKDHYTASREAFLAWRRDNSPRHGTTADHMRWCRARFKLALRQCKSVEQEARALALARKFQEKDMKAFWSDIKTLNSNRPKLPTTVDGISGSQDICRLWKGKFESILNSVDDQFCADELVCRLHSMEETPILWTTPNEISSIAGAMASGKSPGTDSIPLEFFKHAPPIILIWLSNFFNALLIHGFIPNKITEVVISPLLKSSLKDPCNSNNYRPIAHATAVSKNFENIILNRLENYLSTTDYQYGFKTGHGTDTCIFMLKEVINYYKNLNTPIFLCFLDIKSCFDLISYNKLFLILCDRGVPKFLLLILLNWYTHQTLYVRWGGALSEGFGMRNGIRQGSCLSPRLFSAYVDRLNIMLRDSQIGCHVAGTCMNNLSYADDMVLITPDAKSMNQLLQICQNFALDHFITYSVTKTEAMLIKPRGMRDFVPPKIFIGPSEVQYVESFKYLGHIIYKEFTDDSDIEREIRNVYIRGNTIVRKFHFLSLEVKCALFKSYCYPLYTCSLWSKYRVSSINKLKVAYNNILRKLVGVPPWHSARTIFVNLNMRSFFETIRATSYSLVQRVLECQNSIVQALLHSDGFVNSAIRRTWCQNLLTTNQNVFTNGFI